jgi:type I restriction-modification system DNA methylase subunit
MELKELSEKTLELFGISSCDELGCALMNCAISADTEKYYAFADIVSDLSVDWLQKIYQYYQADRKDKKQDYTPKNVAEFMARLCGESGVTVDMCAGSGALTIQRWNNYPNEQFILYEIDDNVFPYLLFNMAIRNIECVVHNADVLQNEIYKTYIISKGEKYGMITEGAA